MTFGQTSSHVDAKSLIGSAHEEEIGQDEILPFGGEELLTDNDFPPML
jgi:hypothetical protein